MQPIVEKECSNARLVLSIYQQGVRSTTGRLTSHLYYSMVISGAEEGLDAVNSMIG